MSDAIEMHGYGIIIINDLHVAVFRQGLNKESAIKALAVIRRTTNEGDVERSPHDQFWGITE